MVKDSCTLGCVCVRDWKYFGAFDMKSGRIFLSAHDMLELLVRNQSSLINISPISITEGALRIGKRNLIKNVIYVWEFNIFI